MAETDQGERERAGGVTGGSSEGALAALRREGVVGNGGTTVRREEAAAEDGGEEAEANFRRGTGQRKQSEELNDDYGLQTKENSLIRASENGEASREVPEKWLLEGPGGQVRSTKQSPSRRTNGPQIEENSLIRVRETGGASREVPDKG